MLKGLRGNLRRGAKRWIWWKKNWRWWKMPRGRLKLCIRVVRIIWPIPKCRRITIIQTIAYANVVPANTPTKNHKNPSLPTKTISNPWTKTNPKTSSCNNSHHTTTKTISQWCQQNKSIKWLSNKTFNKDNKGLILTKKFYSWRANSNSLKRSIRGFSRWRSNFLSRSELEKRRKVILWSFWMRKIWRFRSSRR